MAPCRSSCRPRPLPRSGLMVRPVHSHPSTLCRRRLLCLHSLDKRLFLARVVYLHSPSVSGAPATASTYQPSIAAAPAPPGYRIAYAIWLCRRQVILYVLPDPDMGDDALCMVYGRYPSVGRVTITLDVSCLDVILLT